MTSQPLTNSNPHIAFFSGSFDPFTRGHESIVRRALPLFHKVVIGIGINPDKTPLMSTEARVAWIKSVFAGNPQVEVISYNGYTVEAAQSVGACCIIRGVRNSHDFDYEQGMATFNREASGIETVLLYTLPDEACISSSEFRRLIAEGRDISHLLPSCYDESLIPSHWVVNNQ